MRGESGVFRPAWVAVALVSCVLVGTAVQRCLFCAAPPGEDAAPPPAEVRGAPIDAPAVPAPAPADLTPVPMRKGPPEPERPAGLEDHQDLGFDKLAGFLYEFELAAREDEKKKDQIPQSVHDLDGRKIAIKGFMIPLKSDGTAVEEFVLVRNQGACCFGIVPRMNEWVHVRMASGKSAPYAVDIPLTVFGTLEVGETYQNKLLMSVYRLEATHVIEPPLYR